jgi:hypothetical protein
MKLIPHFIHGSQVQQDARPCSRNGRFVQLLMAATLVLTAGGTACTAETVPNAPTLTHNDANGTVDTGASGKDTKSSLEFTLMQSATVNIGTGAACSTDADCPTTFLACYTPFCDKMKGVCNVKKIQADVDCSDSNKCTEGDRCHDGKCIGSPLACDDGNPCTTDFCIASKGCEHGNLEVPCQDGDLCVLHACQGGACKVIDTAPCDDGNPCTTDLCDPGKGCSYVALNAVACDDGDACSVGDVCKLGTCSGKGDSCNDGNPCTDDSCDGQGKCLYNPNSKPCSDGKPCTVLDTCTQGTCTGTAKNCEDGWPCTIETCDAVTGFCTYGMAAANMACDDGNPCTAGDGCKDYLCKGTDLSCDDANACTADSCAPESGGCVNVPIDSGAACTTGDACTAAATCQLGECVGQTKDCDDANPCTIASCDSLGGACVQTPVANGQACGDGGSCYAGTCL